MGIVISPTASADTYGPVEVGKERNVTFQVIGSLVDAEVINFQVEATHNETTGVSTWRDMTIDTDEIKIDADNDTVTFYGPAYIKIVKSSSAGVVGLRAVNR